MEYSDVGSRDVTKPEKSKYEEKDKYTNVRNTYIAFISKFLFAIFENLAEKKIIEWRKVVDKVEIMDKEDLVLQDREDKYSTKPPNKSGKKGGEGCHVT